MPEPVALPPGWDFLTKILDPMTPLVSSQLAAVLARRELDLEYAEEGSPDFVPYEPSPLGRVFRLGDVVHALDPAAKIEGCHAMAREAAEAALANRVGKPNPPSWFDPEDYPSGEEAAKSKAAMDLILMGLTSRPEPVQNPKGNPTAAKAKADIAAQAAGRRVNRMRGFVSLGDFVLNGRLDDEWILARRPGQRPYDFLDSLATGDGVPWVVLTLDQYLKEVREGARIAGEIDFAQDERAALEDQVRMP